MKITLGIISVAAVALWGGYTLGFQRGAEDTYARLHPNYFAQEVTTSHMTAINTSPYLVTTNTMAGK